MKPIDNQFICCDDRATALLQTLSHSMTNFLNLYKKIVAKNPNFLVNIINIIQIKSNKYQQSDVSNSKTFMIILIV